MSRMRQRSWAYARSELSSSSRAWLRFDVGRVEGEVDSCNRDGSLLNESSGSKASSCNGDGGKMGSGLSGVFGLKLLLCDLTMVDRLPKLRACERLVRLEASVVEVMLLDAEDVDDRASIDVAYAFGRNGERGGSGGEEGEGGDESSDGL